MSRQQKWAMNCYLYAPKDDYKHRSYWRELYTVDEAEHMQALIKQATKHNITFYYAISPGLDIAYSSQKEIATLKRKLDQVCSMWLYKLDDLYVFIDINLCILMAGMHGNRLQYKVAMF